MACTVSVNYKKHNSHLEGKACTVSMKIKIFRISIRMEDGYYERLEMGSGSV